MKDLSIFKTAFAQQIEELKLLLVRLSDDEINRAVELISSCEGAFLVSGLGKSGIIARKIAATFASLGMRASFIHATDALHGDVGVARKGDVAMLLSNSGETQEVLDVLASLRARGVCTIALTGNKSSRLGVGADCVLEAKVSAEACRLNLAPTTSTTAALVVADSLAVAVMAWRKISKDEFAFSHPAGRLGRRLTLRVADLMHSGDKNPKVTPDFKWPDIIARIVDGQLGAVSVVTPDNRLVGVITDGDIRRALARYSWMQLETLCASEIMSENPKTVEPQQTAVEALSLMTHSVKTINLLCVVNSVGESVGLLRLSEISKAGI